MAKTAKKAPAAEPTTGRPNLFHKAATTAPDTTKASKSKGTIIQLPNDPPLDHDKPTVRPSESLREFVEFTQESESLKGKIELAKGAVMPLALDLIAEKWADLGIQPPGPIELLDDSKEISVTYIISNKSGQNPVSAEQRAELEMFAGADAVAKSWLVERQVYSLNSAVLDEPGVLDKLSDAIQNSGMTEKQIQDLLVCSKKTFVQSTVLGRLTDLVGRDARRIGKALTLLGSSAVRYMKV